ncbi:hypothetical protein GGI11_001529 [Coemansia sp. RSA 2049]|nr:hypothetical protein H4217_004628 [Coemansia sp. RSA 1939]KAJ2523166.1 hypothetical protein GGI11_001529 [Coemansia sp. RSA 2049]KAJ2615541.1 hypothetical protein EV177_001515 [Coemansia sp. RSA 1804]
MDFSKSRTRLGNSSHMVNTYGRFRQRMVNRDVMGSEDFARITGIKPILSEMMDSSSDSDFESSKAPTELNMMPVKSRASPKPTKVSLSNTTTTMAANNNKDDTRSRASSTARKAPRAGKSRLKKPTVRDKKTATKTKPATSSKPSIAKKSSTESKPKAELNTPPNTDNLLGPHVEMEVSSLPVPASVAKDSDIEISDRSQRNIALGSKESRMPESPLSSGKVTRRKTNPRGRKSNRPAQLPSIRLQEKEQEEDINNKPSRDLSRRVSQISIAEHEDVQMEEDAHPDTDDVFISGSRTTVCLNSDERDVDIDNKEDSEDEYAGERGQHRQLLATRTMRFKAPKDARPQTVDLDDNDVEMQADSTEDAGSGGQKDDCMVVDSQTLDDNKRLSICSGHNTFFQQETQEVSTLDIQTDSVDADTPNGLATPAKIAQPPATPFRANHRVSEELASAALHSPSRVITPHRVVYSPPRPMTVVRPRFDSIPTVTDDPKPLDITFASKRQDDLDLGAQRAAAEQESGPIQPAISLNEDEKQRKSLVSLSQHRLSTESSMDSRRNTTTEISNEPDIEETTVPFLPARRYVQKTHILAACGQTAPIDWTAGGLQACGVLLPNLDVSKHTEAQISEIESKSGLCKIGEATYSEVFSAQWKYVPKTRYDKFNSKKGNVKGERIMQVALKIIPFGNSSVKSGTGEPQTTLRDLYQEIGATLALSRLSERERAKLQEARMQVKMPLKPKERELGANFVKAFRVCICKGSLPAPLLRAWDRWKVEYPDLCENVRPDYYPENQLFAVFVLEMGGETLENATVSTWKEARSIIRQLALSMALAERNNSFEHRDLHWGNIMVTRYNSNLTFLYQLPPLGNRAKSTLISIPSYKVRCTIIDYTLSRLHIDNDASDTATTTKPAKYDPADNVFYVSLKDEALFQGKGDIQFDVYRQMRECSKGDWPGFHPHTNVLWLTYALHKILITKSPSIKTELLAFAESKIGPAFDSMAPEIRNAAGHELLRRWVHEFEQCETSSQVLKCSLLDLYKN